jgi:hypothetical protein
LPSAEGGTPRKGGTEWTTRLPAASKPATYLIVLRHVLVAQDIAMTIAEFDPGARILTSASGAEALPLLRGVERIAMAFVGKGPQRASAPPRWPRPWRNVVGRVVLMGEEAEAQGEAQGFAVLVRPFGTGDVLAHLDPGQR